MSEINGGAAQTTQWYIIQPTIAFVYVCMHNMAKINKFLKGANRPEAIMLMFLPVILFRTSL